jgi:hypothetical protein
MGTLSKAAHDDGFIVTLVPPESYFDVTTSSYDRSLTHPCKSAHLLSIHFDPHFTNPLIH